MNKKGFIRTLEAVLAVIVIFIFIYSVGRGGYSGDRDVESIKSLQESILGEISRNDEFRDCIVTATAEEIKQINNEGGMGCPEVKVFIESALPPRFLKEYKFNVCDPARLQDCSLPSLSGIEIYTSAVIITSSIKDGGEYSPRILRLWLQ